MATDFTKAAFSSTWDIDQLVLTSSIPITNITTLLCALPIPPSLPMFEIYFSPTGTSKWYKAGHNTKSDTAATSFDVYSYISAGALFLVSTSTGTARYFIWQDRIDN